MRIIIVKNDALKTVGLHVETTAPGHFTPERVFSMGAAPSPFNWVKTVPGDLYEKEVFALVDAAKELDAAKKMRQAVANAIVEAGIKVEKEADGSWGIGSAEFYQDLVERAEKKLQNKADRLKEAIGSRARKQD